jgi:hypothetical protein
MIVRVARGTRVAARKQPLANICLERQIIVTAEHATLHLESSIDRLGPARTTTGCNTYAP